MKDCFSPLHSDRIDAIFEVLYSLKFTINLSQISINSNIKIDQSGLPSLIYMKSSHQTLIPALAMINYKSHVSLLKFALS